MKISNHEKKLFKIYDAPFWFHYFYNKPIPSFMIDGIYHKKPMKKVFFDFIDSIVLNEENYKIIKLCNTLYGEGCMPDKIKDKIDVEILNKTNIDDFSFYRYTQKFKPENIELWLEELQKTSVYDCFNSIKILYSKHPQMVSVVFQKKELMDLFHQVKQIYTKS